MAEPPLLHDRYRVLRRLGRGAFATVYLADDTLMDRQVAVKVVGDSGDADGRALREAKAAAKLNHPHIVHVFEVVQEEDRTLLFTEYVEGETLRALYGARRLSDRDVIVAGIQVCRALEHGHKRGVIHRDIKPENLMILEGDEVDVRVMDFGVAHLEDHAGITREGDVIGTLAYMAPEQLAGEPVDPRADVYALSITLYEGLTGNNPLRGKSLKELVTSPGLQQLPPLRQVRPDLPAVLDEGIHAGLAPEPEDRLDAPALRRTLEKALRQLPEHTQTEPTRVSRTVSALTPGPRLERAAFLARHLLSGALALAAAGYLLQHSTLLPEAAGVPLLLGSGFLALLAPAAGAVVVAALYAVVAFAFGIGWGVLFVLAAAPGIALLYRAGRSWSALLPLAAPGLAVAGLGLAVPALAGFVLRRWGPPVAFASALAVAVAAGLVGWAEAPWTFSVDVPAQLESARYAANPWTVLDAVARLLDAQPQLLLQAVLFAVFAVPLFPLVAGGSAVLSSRRRWGVAVYLAGFFAAFVVLPPVLVGVAVSVGRFFLAYMACVILLLLFGLLVPTEEPHTTTER